MHCFICKLISRDINLIEHEAVKWLRKNELDSVKWLPADIEVVEKLKIKL
ncbi:MAG: mutT [Herbinix sp.]|nr:mutT [Herbinix sp.]